MPSKQKENGPHHVSLVHEAIAAAASYEAMKAYEDHERSQGKPVSNQATKELLAVLAGAALDKFIESKILNKSHLEQLKELTKQNAEQLCNYGKISGPASQCSPPK